MINGYDFPEISYFIQKEKLTGNVYTGSQGENFRYRLAAKDDKLIASVWYEDICYELAENKTEQSYELTNEELVKAIEWILSMKK